MDTGRIILVGVGVALAGGAAIVGARTWTKTAEPVEIEPEPQAVVEVEPAAPERTFAQRERAPDPEASIQEEPRQGRGDRGGDWRQQMMSRFDADGDGEISDEERQAARDAMRARGEQRRAQWISRWDKDGDGELNEEEMGAARAEREKSRKEFEAVLADRFDADGDGELSDIEREAARTAIRTEARDFFSSFDTDGDGQMSDGERQAARDELQRRDAQRKAVATLDADKDGAILSAEATDAIARVHLGDPTADYNADGIVDERDAQVVMDQFTGAADGQESLFDTMRSQFGRGGFGGGRGGPGGFHREGGQDQQRRQPPPPPPGDG